MSGMGSHGPWICLNEMRGLTASNTLYVVTFKGDVSLNDRATIALSLLTSRARTSFTSRARVYSDGLAKLEPSDILEAEIPVPKPGERALTVYADAISALLDGKLAVAMRIADKWIAHR
jgi:hypothetical protein